MAYVDLERLRSHVGISDFSDDSGLSAAIATAEAAVDAYCGRTFATSTSATARLFAAEPDSYVLRLGRSTIGSTTGLLVEVDLGASATWDTVAASDFTLEPVDGIGPDGRAGWPATVIRRHDAWWPVSSTGRPLVRITARWGWAAVPAAVGHATLLLSAELWKLQDAPLGTGTFGAAAFRVEDNAGVVSLLGPFRRAHAVAGIA